MPAGFVRLTVNTRRVAVFFSVLLLAVLPGLSQKTMPPAFLETAAAVSSGSGEAGLRDGYLMDLAVVAGKTLLTGAAEIDNYVENKHLTADDDWLVLLLNERGERIGVRRLRNPAGISPFFPDRQVLPFTVKIPRMEGLASVVVCNPQLEEQIRIPVDGLFKQRAAATRNEFLTLDRENRRLLAEESDRHRKRAAAVRSEAGGGLHFEKLPDETRREIQSDIELELEKLSEPGTRRLRKPVVALEDEPQFVVSGTVYGEGSAVVPGAYLLLRQISPTTTSARSWSVRCDNQGRYSIAVPANLDPRSFVLSAYSSSYVLQSAGIEVAKDMTYDFLLLRGKTISGTVRDSAEKALSGVRVRAFASGMFAGSALTDSAGAYSFHVGQGLYEIEAVPSSSSTLQPAAMKNVLIEENCSANFVMLPAEGLLSIRLDFPSEAIYDRFARKSLIRFELSGAGATAYAGSGVTGQNGFDSGTGKYFRSYSVYLRNGNYRLDAYLAGCPPLSGGLINVAGESAVPIDVPQPFLWTGRLLDASGAPLPGMSVQSYTDLARDYEPVTTDSEGRFSILYTPNGFVKFFTNPGSRNILHTERIGAVIGGRNQDVVLDEFPSFDDSGTPLTQMYGVPDRSSRWNIVMIGDGYTGEKETYADSNGNGRWDGVLYYDLNKNGVWDTGEPYQRYGNASAPVNGTNPNNTNEPFFDANGDGVPNIRDQELFDLNTLDTARSLFGQDEWWRHRDAFNIFRIRLVSRQAGHDILDIDGKTVLQRDTILGTYLHSPDRSYLFSANSTIVSQYINQYVPECDTRIVMVNQPIRMGRVNSYMFQYGGEIFTICNDYVVAHEMGHNIGLLSDEYTEYQQTYTGNESMSRNVTSLMDPQTIPWLAMISPGKEIPSCPGSRGVGLYEGAGYYTGGRYRPTEYCMMVSGNRYCPVCTNEIEIRLADITDVVPGVLTRGPNAAVSGLYPKFEWEDTPGVSHSLLEIESSDGSRLLASIDVYASAFILPFPLVEKQEYRWRIKPASAGRWGASTAWTYFTPVSPVPLFTGIFPQIVAGGNFETVLTAVNGGNAAVEIDISLADKQGMLFQDLPDSPYNPVHFNISPMGILKLPFRRPGDLAAGYASLLSDGWIGGSALFRVWDGPVIRSEAGVGLSKPTRRFLVYIDNTENAISGYAIVNASAGDAVLNMVLRDVRGVVLDSGSHTLPRGGQMSEFAFQRFPATAPLGFEGSLEVSSDQNVAAVALRYDNLNLPEVEHRFCSLPVLVDEMSTELYFPQVADGGGFCTDFVIVNARESGSFVRLEFYGSDGAPQSLPVQGAEHTVLTLPLGARGVARFVTDGTSSAIKSGWVKVMSPDPIFGCAIFQTRHSGRVLSEAGVIAAPAMTHFSTYVDSVGPANSGVAICNPFPNAASLTLNLRRSDGRIAATSGLTLPVGGHSARFFTELFPRGFDEFEGTLEVISNRPVSAVALRFDNPGGTVFATLPVVILP